MIKHLLWALPLLGCQAEVLTCYQSTDCPTGQQCTTAGACVTLRPGLDLSVGGADTGADTGTDSGQPDQGPELGRPDQGPDRDPPDQSVDMEVSDQGSLPNCTIGTCVRIDGLDNELCDQPNGQLALPHALASNASNTSVARAWFDDQDRLHTACVPAGFPRENRTPYCSPTAQNFREDRVQVRLTARTEGWWVAWAHRGTLQLAELADDCTFGHPSVLAHADADDWSVAQAADGSPTFAWTELAESGLQSVHLTIHGETIVVQPETPGYDVESPVVIPTQNARHPFWLIYSERVLIDAQTSEQHVFAQEIITDGDGLHLGDRYDLQAGTRTAAVGNAGNTLIAIVSDDGNQEGDATLRTVRLTNAGTTGEVLELGSIADGQTPSVVWHPAHASFMISWTDALGTARLRRLSADGDNLGEAVVSACDALGPLHHPTIATTPGGYVLQYFGDQPDRLVTAPITCTDD